MLFGAAFLVLAGFLTLLQVLKDVFPAFLDGLGFWTYGRLRPMATAITVFGWLAPTLIGASYYLVSRHIGTPLRYVRLAAFNLWYLAAAVIAGTISIGLGLGDGFELFEFPVAAEDIVFYTIKLHYEHSPLGQDKGRTRLTFYTANRTLSALKKKG